MGARPSQRRRTKSTVTEEVNLIPLMNVFCILIPFLLLTTVFVRLTVINTNLPSAVPADSQKEVDASPTPETKKLNLTVFITKEGFTLAGYGGVLEIASSDEEKGKSKDSKAKKTSTLIPMKVVGKDRDGNDLEEYDFEKLQENLIKIKDEFPSHYSIIILPENQVKYNTIIKTLDTSREVRVVKPGGEEEVRELFVNPVLAGGMT